MASSSAQPRSDVEGNPQIDEREQIEHQTRTLPLTTDEMADMLPLSTLREIFREMQERLTLLEKKNKALEEQLKTKRVTVRSEIVTPEDDRSHHRTGKEVENAEEKSKKTKKHARDRYGKEKHSENTASSDLPVRHFEDRFQPSHEDPQSKKAKSKNTQVSRLKSDTEESKNTDQTNFQSLERRIEEVALGRKKQFRVKTLLPLLPQRC